MIQFHREAYRRTSPWGLVLAAGDGKRLQSFVQQSRGVELPKQYVNFIGQHSMLEHTFQRVERLIPSQWLLTAISKDHLRFTEVRRQLADRPENVIVQPANKETGPGIFLALMHIYKRAPEAIVSVFPSDHFILKAERFIDHVDLAVKAVAHDPSRIVLLAMEAQGPEVEYGYIVAHDDGARDLWGTRNAANFVEKPDLVQTRELVRAGGLWNTMIMVFKVRTVLKMLQRLFPFARIFEAIGTPEEKPAVESVYQHREPMNFSKSFLEKIAAINPTAISVLPVLQVFWSDMGSPERLAQVLALLGRRQATSAPAPAKHKRPCFDPWIAQGELA